jgi:hypothetical protein
MKGISGNGACNISQKAHGLIISELEPEWKGDLYPIGAHSLSKAHSANDFVRP